MNDSLNVSFIIPVLNGEQYISACLDSIENEMGMLDEIILVDNGSTDRTLDIAKRYPRVQLLIHPECTIAGLRNRGAEYSKNDILGFIDSDCTLCPGWRESVISVLAREGVSATGSISSLPLDPTWVERVWLSERKRTERQVNYIPSANFVVTRSAFQLIGGFNERLVTDEDSDIGMRLRAQGFGIIDSPDVNVIHMGNAKNLYQFAVRQKWHATSMLQNFSLKDKPLVMTIFFFCAIILSVIIVFAPLNGRIDPIWGLPVILFVPVITAVYRVFQYGNYHYFFHLILLYFVYYLARVASLFGQFSDYLVASLTALVREKS